MKHALLVLRPAPLKQCAPQPVILFVMIVPPVCMKNPMEIAKLAQRACREPILPKDALQRKMQPVQHALPENTRKPVPILVLFASPGNTVRLQAVLFVRIVTLVLMATTPRQHVTTLAIPFVPNVLLANFLKETTSLYATHVLQAFTPTQIQPSVRDVRNAILASM